LDNQVAVRLSLSWPGLAAVRFTINTKEGTNPWILFLAASLKHFDRLPRQWAFSSRCLFLG